MSTGEPSVEPECETPEGGRALDLCSLEALTNWKNRRACFARHSTSGIGAPPGAYIMLGAVASGRRALYLGPCAPDWEWRRRNVVCGRVGDTVCVWLDLHVRRRADHHESGSTADCMDSVCQSEFERACKGLSYRHACCGRVVDTRHTECPASCTGCPAAYKLE